MKENKIQNELSDDLLENINGGTGTEEVEIVFGTKDLGSDSSQNISSYQEPTMIIQPFVENTSSSTIDKYEERTASDNNFVRDKPQIHIIRRPKQD